MEFKSDEKNSSAISKADKKGAATQYTSKAGAFKINTDSIKSQVIPNGMMTMMGEIGQALGVDLTDLSKLTPEQVTQAKKYAAELDEKLIAMKELMPAVLKFLSFKVSEAEFQAEVVLETCKAKKKIDQAQAKAYVAYYRYLRSAQNLEKRVNQQREIIDAAYSAFESIGDARSQAIRAGLNNLSKLGKTSVEYEANLKEERQQIKADRKQQLADMKHNLKSAAYLPAS